MSMVTITIEDIPQSRVKVVSTPSFELMMKKTKFDALTSAEGYAITALNAIRAASKRIGAMVIPVPRVGNGRK